MDRFNKIADLLLTSLLALFLELAIIRYINSTVQVVAYFNNFLILSSFLGLGVGATLSDTKPHLLKIYPRILALTLCVLAVMDKFGFYGLGNELVVWAVNFSESWRNLPLPFVILLTFTLTLVGFIPLGAKLGTCLSSFEDRFFAYSIDLTGSLLGILSFALISYFQTSPWVWFLIAGLLLLFLLRKEGEVLYYFLFLALAASFTLLASPGVWSPYYKVSWASYYDLQRDDPNFIGYEVSVDRLRIQDSLRFSDALEKDDNFRGWASYYRLPYLFREPSHVLVLGGGTGNDATLALENGAKEVDVVEIDPVLISLGSSLHPHQPYQDARVRTINDDARSFLQKSDKKYDLIVMNALDSHRNIPGLSTLRLESFIYTTEAFRDVAKHLSNDGIFVVHLSSTRSWMGERLYRSLTDALGKEPLLISSPRSPWNSIGFAYGPAEAFKQNRYSGLESVVFPDPTHFKEVMAKTIPATDDWPHLYLEAPQIPTAYLWTLGGIIFTGFLISCFLPGTRQMLAYPDMFFLGAAFMLLETRTITSVALYFGLTWFVNAVAIGSILFILILGNRVAALSLKSIAKVAFVALCCALIAGYFVQPTLALGLSFWPKLVVAGSWFALPLFFASILFSHCFGQVKSSSAAFGANLLGVVLGGVLEYSSMVFGLNALYPIALLLYLVSFVAAKAYGRL